MVIFLYNPATNPATNVFLGGLNLVIKTFWGRGKRGGFLGEIGCHGVIKTL
jgi:hypothetical protein